MRERVTIEGVEYPRHAVQFGHVASLLRLATHNAIRRAEHSDLAGDVPARDVLAGEMRAMAKLAKEQFDRMKDVLDNCYGPPGHDWSRETDYCNRCGADGRA